jgi:hypothetical protein
VSNPSVPRPLGPRKGFFQISNRLIDDYGPQLGPYGLAVYVALARRRNREGYCWPSYKRLARDTHMSRRKVIEVVKELEELELVYVERDQYNDAGDATSNRFYIPFLRSDLADVPGGSA